LGPYNWDHISQGCKDNRHTNSSHNIQNKLKIKTFNLWHFILIWNSNYSSQYLFQTQAIFHTTNKFWHFKFHFSDRNSNLQARMVLKTERHKHRQKHWCSVLPGYSSVLPLATIKHVTVIMLASLIRCNFSYIQHKFHDNFRHIQFDGTNIFSHKCCFYYTNNNLVRWWWMQNFKQVLLVWNRCLTCLCCNGNLLKHIGLNISYDLSCNRHKIYD
jgi:hypothetical protein